MIKLGIVMDPIADINIKKRLQFCHVITGSVTGLSAALHGNE